MSKTPKSKFPKPGSFTAEELTEWFNTLDMYTMIAILEKLWKDLRDYTILKYDEDLKRYIANQQTSKEH